MLLKFSAKLTIISIIMDMCTTNDYTKIQKVNIMIQLSVLS